MQINNFKNISPVFVGGANGFTGRFICKELKKNNVEFLANLRPGTSPEWMIRNNINYVYSNLNDHESLTKAIKNCNSFINASSLAFGVAPIIIQSCKKINIKRVVFISTTSIFTSLNVNSKKIRKIAEEDIKNSDLDWTILRPTMIFGSTGDRNMIRLIKWIDKFPIIPIFGNGKYFQQPVNVRDIAWATFNVLMNSDTIKESFNLSGAKAYNFNQIIDLTSMALRKKVFKFHISLSFSLSIFKFFENLKIKLPIKSEQLKRINENKDFSYAKAFRYFNYQPFDFYESIKKEVEEYKQLKNKFY